MLACRGSSFLLAKKGSYKTGEPVLGCQNALAFCSMPFSKRKKRMKPLGGQLRRWCSPYGRWTRWDLNPRPPAFLELFGEAFCRRKREKGSCKAGALPLRHEPANTQADSIMPKSIYKCLANLLPIHNVLFSQQVVNAWALMNFSPAQKSAGKRC